MQMPISLDPDVLSRTIFAGEGKFHHFTSVGSTNAEAMRAAAAGAPEGSVFLADEQTAGRGRSDHSWHSPAGSGLYVSVVLRPALAANEVLWLSLIAGLAAHDAIRRVTGHVCDLRWPNDLMAGGALETKLGGVLTEMGNGPGGARLAVIGVGINVNQAEFPPEIAGSATSLRLATGREWPRQALLSALLQSLDKEYRALQSDARAAGADVVHRFAEYSSYAQGARVQVDDHSAASFTGVTAGLDQRGFLRVETAEGVRTVLSGGVRKIGKS